jgi:hypothetical protein
MSQANVKAAPVAAKAATSHEPLREVRPNHKQTEESSDLFIQRATGAMGGTSPRTPPGNFGSLLGKMQGSSSMQAGLLLQLQRKYGNNYVGQVIQRKSERHPVATQRPTGGDKNQNHRASAHADLPHTVTTALTSNDNGQKLDHGSRGVMEKHLGHDLQDVAVHTDSRAADAAHQLQAQAFTVGRDIYFAAGNYQPDKAEGQKLLAHELTHVVQQRSGATATTQHKLRVGPPDDVFEKEADAVAEKVATSESSAMRNISPAPVQAARSLQRATLSSSNSLLIQRNGDSTTAGQTSADAPASIPATEQNQSSGGTMDEDRLKRINEILSNAWVGPLDEYELESIWNSFGPSLPQVAAQNFDLWNQCIDRGAELWDLDALKPMKEAFKAAVVATAQEYLDENEEYVKGEMERLGVNDLEKEATEEQSSALGEIQKVAEKVKKAQDAHDAFLSTTIGYDYPFNKDATEFQAKHSKFYGKQFAAVFSPSHPENPWTPTEPNPPPHEGQKLPSWEETNDKYRKNEAALAYYSNLSPTVFALIRDRKVGDVADSNDPKAMRRTIAKSMNGVLDNIRATRPRLSDKLYLELHPIHDELYESVEPWDQPFGKEVAHTVVKDYESAQFWKSIGLTTLAAALFIVASLATAGTATFWMAAIGAAVVGGTQATRSWLKYRDISTAGGSTVDKETSLIAGGQASAALVEAVMDTVFAFLDVYGPAARVLKGGGKALGVGVQALEAAEKAEAKLAGRELTEAAEKEAVVLAERETAEQVGRGLGRRVIDALHEFVKEVKNWAQNFFKKFGFRGYEVIDEGETIAIYGIKSRILLARINKKSVQEWLISNEKEIKDLRHTRASRLGAAKAAKASGKDAMGNALRGGAVKLSEELGELAAMAAVEAQFPGAKLIHRGAGSGTLDLIYRDASGFIIVVEAKGGQGRLITRAVSGVARAEQGTVTYMRSVLKEMGLRGDDAIANEVLEALNKGRVKYMLSKTSKLSGTQDLLTKTFEFF